MHEITKMKNQILNNFVKYRIFKVAENYLTFKKQTNKNSPKILIEYLDNSFEMLKNLDQISLFNKKFEKSIKVMDHQKSKKFKQEADKFPQLKKLCMQLNFIYAFVKNKSLQDQILDELLLNELRQKGFDVNQAKINQKFENNDFYFSKNNPFLSNTI